MSATIVGYNKTTETRTVVYTTGDTSVTYHQVRSITVATSVEVSASSLSALATVKDSTKITTAQAGNESNNNRLTSTVTIDPITEKNTRTNTFVYSIDSGGTNGWENESRETSN
ncbi:MAG: hypothetical protein IJT88_02435 [Kiritimatiellae bacterium]|nr:hypothetical protein [Kiritimatiellia bacterium]